MRGLYNAESKGSGLNPSSLSTCPPERRGDVSVSPFSQLPFSRCDAGSHEMPQYLCLWRGAVGREQDLLPGICIHSYPSRPPSLWPRTNKIMQNDTVCDQCPANQCHFCAAGAMLHKVCRVPCKWMQDAELSAVNTP